MSQFSLVTDFFWENERKYFTHPALNDKFRKAEVDKILETVKSQCGNHSFRSMAEILNISTASMRNRIRKGGIALSKQEGECYFCESKNIDSGEKSKRSDVYYPLIKVG